MSPSPRRFRPAVERLEARDVPATTTVLTNLSQGVLTVEGTDYADRVTVTYANSSVRVQASTAATGTAIDQSFAAAGVAMIVVAAEGGNDTVVIDLSVTKNTRVYGGTGNDLIYGGNGADYIWGGTGSDTIYGRGGNDILFGDGGTDYLDGGAGTNTVVQETQPRQYFANTVEQQVVSLVNIERYKAGLRPLALSSLLSNAARLHSLDMVRGSNVAGPSAGLQHTIYGSSLPTLTSRLDYVGFTNYTAWGENIAYGYNTAQAVVTAWMNSPGHRANILSPNYTQIGVALATDAAGRVFWTQEFAAK